MNKNVRKTITENNSKNKKISKTDKINNNSIESKSGKNKYYKYLKFINKKIIPKKEEIIASKSKIISHIKKIFFNAAKYSNKEEAFFLKFTNLVKIISSRAFVFILKSTVLTFQKCRFQHVKVPRLNVKVPLTGGVNGANIRGFS